MAYTSFHKSTEKAPVQYIHPSGHPYYVYWTADFLPTVVDFPDVSPSSYARHRRGRDDVEIYKTRQAEFTVDHFLRRINRRDAPHTPESQWDAEIRYWEYVGGHPNHYYVDHTAYQNALEALRWCCADRILFGDLSNAPFTAENSHQKTEFLIALHDDVEKFSESTQFKVIQTWFIAIILEVQARHRQHCLYGTPMARSRRERDQQDELDDPDESFIRRLLAFIISWLFFGISASYLRRIQAVDRTKHGDGITTFRWQGFLDTLVKGWSNMIIVATLLVSAGTGFLAVPRLGIIAQTATFASMLASFGSLLAAIFLILSHQSLEQSGGKAGLKYFWSARVGSSNVYLSIVLSTPFVLLVWSSIAFLVGILDYALDGSMNGNQHSGWMTVAGGIAVLSLLLISLPFFIMVHPRTRRPDPEAAYIPESNPIPLRPFDHNGSTSTNPPVSGVLPMPSVPQVVNYYLPSVHNEVPTTRAPASGILAMPSVPQVVNHYLPYDP